VISIIIPAHNEEQVIERSLRALLEGSHGGELEVIVACNGCTDATADLARSFGPGVRVIETEVPSKSHALNLGDRAASGFPRFYVDADIVLPLESIRRVAAVLESGAALAAAPAMHVDLAGCPWSIRAYYDVWLRLPYVNDGMLGCGVYAVSRAGRARFGPFPNIIADDEFVRVQFSRVERVTVASAAFVMSPPKKLALLVHINLRRLAGDQELRGVVAPALLAQSDVRHRPALIRLARRPSLWPALCVYVYVKVATLALYSWRALRGTHKAWARDDSSRRTPVT
jgi:glycosyltransferase involved in cell wall biosynthesis